MKFVLIFILLFILSAGNTQLVSKKYIIEILQDGEAQPVNDGIVWLEKKPFQIRIILRNHDGVYLSSSFGRLYYDLNDDEPIPDFEYLSSKTRAEPNFNADQELITDDEQVSYLFFDPGLDWHRFDPEVEIKGKQVICTKTVRKVFDQDLDSAFALQDINQPLFLFFLAVKDRRPGKLPRELGRQKVMLNWK